MAQMRLWALEGFPEIQPGTDLSSAIVRTLKDNNLVPEAGDVLVVAQKVVSKAEGRIVDLREVTPTPAGQRLAEEIGKDARLVEVILRESRTVSRRRPGLLITEHRLGFICANAGVDHSNVAGSQDIVSLLPLDPDQSAKEIRTAVRKAFGADVGVIISDSHGRPHRQGAVGVAIGLAGLAPLLSYVGQPDRYGYVLRVTVEALADELAAAAGLLQGQATEGTPVVLIRGARVPQDEEAGGAALVRRSEEDLYR